MDMRHSRTVILLVGFGCITVLFLPIMGAFPHIESTFHVILLPINRVASSIGSSLHRRMESNAALEELSRRNQELERRVAALALDTAAFEAAQEENRSLRAMTNFLEESRYDYIPARIIGRTTETLDEAIIIDRGARDGLEVGMAVIANEGLFVGKITALKERIATVGLLTGERSRVAASMTEGEGMIGVVEGRGNRVARLTFIPQEQRVETDALIVTAGTEEKVPRNLPIGLVNVVEGKPTDPFKIAIIEPLVNIDALDLLLVLRASALRPDGT